MSCCEGEFQQIVGNAFSLQLQSTECPVMQGGVPLTNTTGWIPKLQILLGTRLIDTITGSWLSSVSPFQSAFEKANTSGWSVGTCDVRIMYQAPDGRSFAPSDPVLMQLQVIK